MPELITPERIHGAAEVLRKSFLPFRPARGAFVGYLGVDPDPAPVELAEPLADLLVAQARTLADWLITHGHGESLDRLLQLPDWRAVAALVETLEGSHR